MTESLLDPTSGKALILIAEDELEIAEILIAYLKRAGFQTVHAQDGRRALQLHQTLKPDLVLLDVMMPKLDGWMVLAEIRHRGNTPVIMLTAHDQDMGKLMGLRIGADDSIVKPFNPAEVIARIEAVLRRCTDQGHGASHSVLRVEAFEIDIDSHEVSVRIGTRNQPLSLTVTELRLPAQLAKAPRRVFSRAELLVLCSPESDSLERTVDSHISNLRRKIEDVGLHGVPSSIRGVGYRFGNLA